MSFAQGQDLLHYRLVEKIGEGGMGEVWKATDTTLDRQVAIKFIPENLANDGERLARFTREAKMLAALNHPNIAAVYGLHEVGVSTPATPRERSVQFIAMELVPGEDLSQRLARGPLPVDEALDLARQVAAALEAAHEQGVIHRDLKPANIKITPEGKVKVLDLGLAKALAPEASGGPSSVSLSPTLTVAGTAAGMLMGTAAYMSPEQAKGRPVDRRADIWAFGVVLFEMLTGRKLFAAETVSETLAAVLRDEIPLASLPAGVPAPAGALLRRCLDRDPRTRLRDIGEARIALSAETLAGAGDATIATAPGEGAAAAQAAGASRLIPWALAAVLGIVAAYALWQAQATPAPESPLLTLVAPIPADLKIPSDQMGVLALAPDGKTLAMALDTGTSKQLYIRQLDRTGMTLLPGTDDAATPFFSPDGRWIAFFSGGKLKKVAVAGGSPVTLCDARGSNRGASWGTDDFIVYSPHYTQPLMRVSGAGGEPEVLTTIDKAAGDRTHRWPQAVPGEDLVLFTVGTMDSPESYDDARIEALRPSTGKRRTVLRRASMARYVPSGHLIFGREGFLFAVPFDVGSLETRGEPVPVVEGVMGERSSGIVHMDAAESGLLAYLEGAGYARQSRLAWKRREGEATPLPVPLGGYLAPRISPDGRQIALQIAGGSNFDIHVHDLGQETLRRLTFEGDNGAPAWSPDGRLIAFASVRDNALMSVYVKASDGSGVPRMVFSPDSLENAGQIVPYGWTPDGSGLIVGFTNENASNLAIVEVERGEMDIILETPASEEGADLSPDGRWLAYASDEAGDFQVFVQPFPAGGGKWQISRDGGVGPRWSPDGKELFYRWQDDLYAVPVDNSSGGFRPGNPRVLFSGLRSASVVYDYDVAETGKFLVVEPMGIESGPAGVTVMVNWLDDLSRRVPR